MANESSGDNGGRLYGDTMVTMGLIHSSVILPYSLRDITQNVAGDVFKAEA